MRPIDFPEANVTYGPPPDLAESQCGSIRAFAGTVDKGSCEGSRIVVVAHIPDARQLAELNAGAPIFLTVMGGLAPHILTTNFAEAVNIA